MDRAPDQPARHDTFDHLYLRTIMMVLASVAATSFVICFISLSPHASASAPRILDRGRGRRRLLPVFVRHQPHRPAQWLLHVHEGVSHHAHTIIFAVAGRPVRLPGLRPILPPQPAAPTHGRSRKPTDAR
jgi:hypothetical protein